MKNYHYCLIISALISLIHAPLLADSDNKNFNKSASPDFNSLKLAIQHRHVSRLIVMHLSNEIPTRASVEPNDLESIADNKYIKTEGLNRGQDTTWINILDGTLTSGLVPGWMDYRWGVIFYDKNNVVIASIYIDGSGHNAQINGKLVGIHGKLYPWLKSTFGALMN